MNCDTAIVNRPETAGQVLYGHPRHAEWNRSRQDQNTEVTSSSRARHDIVAALRWRETITFAITFLVMDLVSVRGGERGRRRPARTQPVGGCGEVHAGRSTGR